MAQEKEQVETCEEMGEMKFRTKDNVLFEVPREVAFEIGLVPDMVEFGNREVEEIPLSAIESRVFAKIVEYCRFALREKKGDLRLQHIKEWESKFCEMDNSLLLDLVMAANYLIMERLLNLLCMYIADEMKSRTTVEIRKRFQIDENVPLEDEIDNEELPSKSHRDN